MEVKSLSLVNYRNYLSADLNLNSGVTLVFGKNAQGKTNLVESLVLLSTTKSPRTTNMQELVLDGAEWAKAEAVVKRRFGEIKLAVTISLKGEKHFFVNGNEVKKLSDVFGNLVTIYFSPQDLKIVSATPQDRRDFMDTDIAQLSGSYYNLLQRYNKILLQRNKLLKFEKNLSLLKSQIAVWNEQLSSVAALIIKTRKSFINKLYLPAKEAMRQISENKDELEISYVGPRGETSEEIKKELLKSLEINFERDRELGYTTIGPHRDDLCFMLNGKDARNFSSQGQQRSIVLAIKFAQMEIFEKELNESPILVLDDVFSELDTSRQKKLYDKMSKYQTIITGTTFKFKPSTSYDKVIIEKGKIKSVKKIG